MLYIYFVFLGSILNMEMVIYRVFINFGEILLVDLDEICWVENGLKVRVFVYGLRIFYIVGKF